MLWYDVQKFKPILQSNVIKNILASKLLAWIQKDALSSSGFQISGSNTHYLSTPFSITAPTLKLV